MGTLSTSPAQPCSSQLSSSAALLLLQLQLLPLLSRLPLPTTHPLCILRSVMHHPSTTRGMSSLGMSSPGTTTSTIPVTIQDTTDTTDTTGIKHSKDTTTTTMDMPAPTTTIWSSRKTKRSRNLRRFNVY